MHLGMERRKRRMRQEFIPLLRLEEFLQLQNHPIAFQINDPECALQIYSQLVAFYKIAHFDFDITLLDRLGIVGREVIPDFIGECFDHYLWGICYLHQLAVVCRSVYQAIDLSFESFFDRKLLHFDLPLFSKALHINTLLGIYNWFDGAG